MGCEQADGCTYANSELTIRKAIIPGNTRMPNAWKNPWLSRSSPQRSNKGPNPSTGIAIARIARNMHGARKNIEEKGLAVAGFCKSNICVSDHRTPDRADAVITRANPMNTNCASLATIITTPTVMMPMIPTSFQVIFSSLKANANRRTNASDEDLHMADNY